MVKCKCAQCRRVATHTIDSRWFALKGSKQQSCYSDKPRSAGLCLHSDTFAPVFQNQLPNIFNLKSYRMIAQCRTIDSKIIINPFGDYSFIDRLELNTVSMDVIPWLTLVHVRTPS